jgi:imidazole glycerol phosphate synthase glutamine amidotransferase subunit
MKVTLVDHGAGNVASVERALQRLGAESLRANSAACIAKASALILPGVGHFAALIRVLDELQLRTPLVEAIGRGVPFFGICLGLQALFESSDEAPDLFGLRLLSGNVRALPATVKLPHMGWNQLRTKRESRLLEGLDESAYFYFAHSYAAVEDGAATVATCTHGTEFTAVLEEKNICAVQFHPEKSGAAGARVLHNFLRLAS